MKEGMVWCSIPVGSYGSGCGGDMMMVWGVSQRVVLNKKDCIVVCLLPALGMTTLHDFRSRVQVHYFEAEDTT